MDASSFFFFLYFSFKCLIICSYYFQKGKCFKDNKGIACKRGNKSIFLSLPLPLKSINILKIKSTKWFLYKLYILCNIYHINYILFGLRKHSWILWLPRAPSPSSQFNTDSCPSTWSSIALWLEAIKLGLVKVMMTSCQTHTLQSPFNCSLQHLSQLNTIPYLKPLSLEFWNTISYPIFSSFLENGDLVAEERWQQEP